MKKCHALLDRLFITEHSTTGKLYLNNKYFCETLEDVVRDEGVKVPKKTAIPAGFYHIRLTYSNRFKKVLPLIYNNDAYDLKIIHKGVQFSGVRFHGGNTHLHTEGCPLVAYKKINNDYIQGSAIDALVAKFKEFDDITLEVRNSFDILTLAL